MSAKQESSSKVIEARLERSLRNQVQIPRLDRSFDAAVWARIGEEEAKAGVAAAEAAPTRAMRAARWLAITNIIGVAATLGVALYFMAGYFGVEAQPLNVGLNMPMPAISNDLVHRVTGTLGQVLGILALLFGLSLTSFGRRLRASFS